MSGDNFENAASVGAKTMYGPPSSTLTMLISGFNLPDIAALKVLRSGLLAMAWDAVWSAMDGIEPAPEGT